MRGVTAPADFKADEFLSLVNTEGVRVDCTDIVSYKTFPLIINPSHTFALRASRNPLMCL